MRVLCASLVVAGLVAGVVATSAPAGGNGLVFWRGGETGRAMLMRPDGTDQQPAPFGGYPSYSPNGRRVLFFVHRNSTDSIVIANADGSGRRTLVPPRYCLGGAAWSPDSTKIAYVDDCDVDIGSVWVVGADGRHRKRLTKRWNLAPVWSPDGRTLLVTGATRRRDWRLFLVDADGRHRRLVHGRYPSAGDANFYAHWSLDGRRIFLLPGETKRLLVMNRDGSGVQDLTPAGLSIGSYELSPDERTVVVSGITRPGPRDVFTFPTAGGPAERLTDSGGVDQSPTWSPDSATIAFESNRDRNFEIYVMNADGSNEANLTNNPADDRRVSWLRF